MRPIPYHRWYLDECVSRRCRGLRAVIRRRNRVAEVGKKVARELLANMRDNDPKIDGAVSKNFWSLSLVDDEKKEER